MTDGEKLRKWRKFRGLSQTVFADKCGVSRQTVRAWEANQWRPTDEKQATIAGVLGLPAPRPATSLPEPPRGA